MQDHLSRRVRLPEPILTIISLQTIDETIKAVNTRFDTNSVLYDSWKDNAKSRSDRICLDDEGEHKPLATNTCIPTETTFEPFRDQGVPATSIEDLAKQMEALKINQAQVLSPQLGQLQRNLVPDDRYLPW
ncbi:hypothetical protein L218DRAFT_1002889 [Marasmius fiardii PR-910]|nr:hypothetical protein L218DRAFT_1002889 [Marasmius fiardii PR-910]